MARTAAPSSHPDPDLLTAFGENALSAKERRQIVEHLSICADCREIVFLAQPEVTIPQTVLAPKPRRFTWMAWASVAAVVVVVASAVLLQHEQGTKTQELVTVATTTPAATPETKPAAPLATPAEKPVPAAKTRPVPSGKDTKVDAAKAKTADKTLTAKDFSENEEHAYMKAPVPAAAPPAIMNQQQVIVTGATSQQVQTGPEQRNVAGQIQQRQGPSNTANNANIAVTDGNLAKAEPASRAKVAKKQRADALQDLATGYAGAPAATPVSAARAHWQISSTGTLERSYIADNWTPVLSETGAKFHVVSVIGNTVWAGGEHGALYVSRDGGATWKSIAIDTTATITSVHFSEDSHGTLETGDGQVWKTSDGGQTWQKQ